MEYNRIAVVGHADLANHVRHRVALTGTVDERDDGLRFVVDEVTEIAPTCELQASASGVMEPYA